MSNPFTYPAWDLVSGEALDALPYTGVSFGAPVNQPGSWSGQVSLAALAAANLAPRGPRYAYPRATQTSNTALFVDYGGVLIWGGILWASDYDSADPQKMLKIGATEFHSWFSSRLQAEDYSTLWQDGGAIGPADPMLIAQRICEDALAQATIMGGITLVLHPAGGEGGPTVSPSYAGTSLQTIDSIVQTLSQMGYGFGFDYSFDVAYLPGTRTPSITLNFWYPRQGRSAQESRLVLLSRDCTFTYPIDGSQQATSVTESGSGSGALSLATASFAVPDYPLLQRTWARSQVTDEATLAKIAFGDLALYCYGSFAPTFTIPIEPIDPATGRQPPTAPMALGSFDRGDDFTFRVDPIAGAGQNTDPRFPDGCEFAWRINAWQVTVADKGLSTLVLTGGIPPIGSIPPPQPPL